MDDGQTLPPEQLHLAWETRIRILANPEVWKPILLAFGIPSVLLGLLLAAIAKRPGFALLIPLAALAFLLGIFVLVAVVIDLAGGFKCHFFLTTRGVRCVSGRGARAASAATVVAGMLAGSPGAAGAGLLAESEQNVFIAWPDITRIKVKAGRRYLHVKRAWGFKPIGLHCTAANFPQVMDILRYYAGDKLK